MTLILVVRTKTIGKLPLEALSTVTLFLHFTKWFYIYK